MSTAPATMPAPVRIRLSDQDVENLLGCANFGVGLWASTVNFDRAAKTYHVIEGHEELAADEEPANKVLTYAEIRKAFCDLAAEGLLPEWQMREIRDNDLGFDATVGDMTVQKAVFGKVVFS